MTNESVLTYLHSLPAPHYEQLCALPEAIARYAPKAKGTKIWEQIRRDCVELPTDPATGNRLLEVDNDSQEAVLAMLDWAAHRSGDVRFAWLARDLREGAAESDRKMAEASLLN